MKILIYEFKLFIDSPLFGTIVFHEEEINENKKGKGKLAILYNKEAEREPVILHKFCLPCVTHFHRCKETIISTPNKILRIVSFNRKKQIAVLTVHNFMGKALVNNISSY